MGDFQANDVDDTAILTELRTYIRPIACDLPRSDRADLAFLDDVIGDAKIVCLGEATHGTAELFRMKHRIIDYLVDKKGFRILALEANWAEAGKADNYLKTGHGTAEEALRAMNFWVWCTTEVRDLLVAMRARNAVLPGDEQLSLAGFDIQSTHAAIRRVVEYCTDLDSRNIVQNAYSGLLQLPDFIGDSLDLPIEQKHQLIDDASAVLDWLGGHRTELIKSSSAAQYQEIVQAARVISQSCGLLIQDVFNARERAMAENIRWLIDERYPERKLIVWAHNFHVGSSTLGERRTMGSYLRDHYSNEMVVLALTTYSGEVTARRISNGEIVTPPGAQRLHPAPHGSLESALDSTGLLHLMLDFRSVPRNTKLGQWLSMPKMHLSIGSAFDPDGSNHHETVLADTYDGIVFASQSSATRPIGEGQAAI